MAKPTMPDKPTVCSSPKYEPVCASTMSLSEGAVVPKWDRPRVGLNVQNKYVFDVHWSSGKYSCPKHI